jgi:hypothetical protein
MQLVVPLENVRITLTPGKTVKRAVTLVRPSRLAHTKDASGRVTLVVPRVEEFETIVLES